LLYVDLFKRADQLWHSLSYARSTRSPQIPYPPSSTPLRGSMRSGRLLPTTGPRPSGTSSNVYLKSENPRSISEVGSRLIVSRQASHPRRPLAM
jgi:hypothetical protein